MRFLFTRYSIRWAPVLLRLALGCVFMAHGWEKLTGPLGTPEGFDIIESWGWSNAAAWAWAVALVETSGGLLIIVGLFTRIAAAALAVLMVVAILKVRLAEGFIGGFEFEFTLLMVALALMVTGGGKLSVDRDVLGLGLQRGRSTESTREEG